MDPGAETRGGELADADAVRATLLAAVDAVEPVLAAQADEAQRIGTLPEPAWRALAESGLLRMKAPHAIGGFEADPVTQILVFERVAGIDTSAGWTLFVGAGNHGYAHGLAFR
jgi:alkylation response protein AidB-like acyl-CoA dehydrogenase